MSLVLLVVIVLAGAVGSYALARRFAVEQNGAAMLAGIAALTAILVAAATPHDSGRATIADAPAAPVTVASEAASAAPVADLALPSPVALPFSEVQNMSAESGLPPGSVDRVVFAPAGGGTYDPLAHRASVNKGTTITLSGWAADLPGKSVYRGALALVDGKVVGSALYGFDRGDVAKYYKIPPIRLCGYSVQLPDLAPGSHRVEIGVIELKSSHYKTLVPPLEFVVKG